MDGTQLYKLKYEKRYGSIFRNPWSQEELLKSGIRSFGDNDQALWIKAGDNAFGFKDNFDKVEEFIINESASNAYDYLEENYDRKENIKEIIEKWK